MPWFPLPVIGHVPLLCFPVPTWVWVQVSQILNVVLCDNTVWQAPVIALVVTRLRIPVATGVAQFGVAYMFLKGRLFAMEGVRKN